MVENEKDSNVKSSVRLLDKWWCLYKPNFFDNDVFNEIKNDLDKLDYNKKHINQILTMATEDIS